MTETNQQQLGKTLWAIADQLRSPGQHLLRIPPFIQIAYEDQIGLGRLAD